MFIPASRWPPPIGRGLWVSIALGAIVVASALFTAVAHAQTASELFEQGSAAFAAGDYLRAAAHFEDARDAGSDGPAVHFNLAVCHFRLEQYTAAASGFEHVATTFPQMRELALYNLGLVRLRQNQADEARRLFVDIRSTGRDQKLVALAGEQLRRMQPARAEPAPRSAWLAYIDANLGYDDNVALIDEASVPATQSVDSAFTQFFAVLSGPRRAASGFRFDGTVYAVLYDDATEFDQTALRAAGIYQWLIGSWWLEAGPHANYSTLDGDGFEQRAGLSMTARRALGQGMWFTARAYHDEVDGADDAFAFLEGSREQLSLSFDRQTAAGVLSFGLDLESNDRVDPRVAPSRSGLWLGYRYTAAARWRADGRIGLRNSSYDDLVTPRDEDLIDLSFGYAYRLGNAWELTGRLRWSDNDSNVTLYTYSRSRLSVGLTRSF